MEPRVRVDRLSYRYPGSGRLALDAVSLSVARGEYLAVLGRNGSGKSTLVRCIAGLLDPTDGTVAVEREGGAAPSGLVFQFPADQLVAETVELDAAFGPENLGIARPEMRARVSGSLARAGLSGRASARVDRLSAGERQRLALAGVYALDPAVFLLDEPNSMSGERERAATLDYLDDLARSGGTIIHVTHDLDEARRASRVVVMENGRVAFDGARSEFDGVSRVDLSRWGLVSGGSDADAESRRPRPGSGGNVVARARIRVGGDEREVELRAGRAIAVTGESGSGKTVFLEMIAGLRFSPEGAVERDASATVAMAVQESESALFAEFVADDVAYGPRNEGLSGSALVDRVRFAMDLVGLPFGDFAERRTFSLSGGERRKAALAGIVAMETDIVILDEPTAALDPVSRAQVLRLIGDLRSRGKCVVFATGRSDELSIADEVVDLGSGFSLAGTSLVAPSRPTSEQRSLERLRAGAVRADDPPASPVLRLSPSLKYLLAAAPIAASLLAPGWASLSALAALELIPVAVARFPARRLVRGLLSVLPWILAFAALQYWLWPDLGNAAIFVLRFLTLYLPLSLFVFSTDHTEIVYGIEDALRPLRAVRAPVGDFALVVGVVFRFIPLLYGEAARISVARIVRQGRAARRAARNPVARALAAVPLFVPLVIRTLVRAERLAEAIAARYYGTGKRTRYLDRPVRPAEIALAVFLVASVVAFAFISRSMGAQP